MVLLKILGRNWPLKVHALFIIERKTIVIILGVATVKVTADLQILRKYTIRFGRGSP